MFGRKRRFGNSCKGRGSCLRRRVGARQAGGNFSSLSEAAGSRRYLVLQNHHKQTLEMGIAPHSFIYLHRNQANEENLIVGLQELRLTIPRNVAEQIKVK
jgi:Fe2+ transport system protein FeoA